MPVLDRPRHERYAQGLAAGQTQIKAYAAAGFKGNDASAARLAGTAKIKSRVAELLAQNTEYVRMNANQLLERIEKVLDADPRRLVNNKGRLRKLHELGDAEAAAIAGFDFSNGKRVVKLLPKDRFFALYAGISGMTRQEGPLGPTTLESLVSQSLTVNVQVNVNGPAQVQVGAPLASAQPAPGAPLLEAKAKAEK